MISEIHYTHNTRYSIPSYSIISLNHPDNTAYNGAIILIRFPLQFTSIPKINKDYHQTVIVKIKLNHVLIIIAAMLNIK